MNHDRDYQYEDDEDSIWCDRCQGTGSVDCCCGGDQCYCENGGEKDCPRCSGEGRFVPRPGQLEREAKAAREMRAVLASAFASVDTLPKGGDGEAGSVRSKGSAVDAEGDETP